ncbi:hypothetical protein MAH1_13890 [Sessilibacter sp. MAH1]
MYNGKPFSDGPSLIPIIPIFPVIALLIGIYINKILPYAGAVLFVITHFGYIAYVLYKKD